MAMSNPPHPGRSIRENCLDPLGLNVTEAAKVLGVARHTLSVSNSSSGRRWKLDHAPAVGDPTHMVEFGTGRRAFAREA